MRDHHRARHADRPRSGGLVHRRRLAGRRARGPSARRGRQPRLFEPGARTHWHTHPEGQILYIVTGVLPRRRRRASRPSRSPAGGVVYFAPDEKHWHGATPRNLHGPHGHQRRQHHRWRHRLAGARNGRAVRG
jgi:hypothetical protein